MKQHMKLNIEQTQTQKLAMTQDMQQSLKLLQATNEEVYCYLTQKALENPLIEVKREQVEEDSYPISSHFKDSAMDSISLLPEQPRSLFDYLLDQIHLNYREGLLRTLVLYLVQHVTTDGYLAISLEEVQQEVGASKVELIDALTLLQQLEPAGVGARNLQECLLLQIERSPTVPNLAYVIVENELEPLSRREWTSIAKLYECSLAEVQEVFDFIQTLSATPGQRFSSTEAGYITPDLIVQIKENQLQLSSSKQGNYRLHFQHSYFDRLEKVADEETKRYLTQKKQEFQQLSQALNQRKSTVFSVGEVICEVERAFFTEKSHPLVPLTLKEVAERLELHESTISRAVNGKYLQTNFGVFELRSFFSKGLKISDSSELISNTEVKQQLLELIENENTAKPLSDQRLVNLLNERGVCLSRRTIAKYRELLHIPASSKRKRYTN
ncbi:MAG: RNA polymerase factor sigma-54 [Lactobacillales bacterium]|nr:RNA polymerase factor sigma-54 [Lactobacillales bacterium]